MVAFRPVAEMKSPALGGAIGDAEQFLSRFAPTCETHADEARTEEREGARFGDGQQTNSVDQ